MVIKYANCVGKKEINVIYVEAVKKDNDGTILEVKYQYLNDDGKWEEQKTISASDLGKKLYSDSIVAWGGRVDNDNNQFKKVCKIVPQFTGGKFCITSVCDDDDSNNLENFPEYK